jgi:signal transduction histidine kinase
MVCTFRKNTTDIPVSKEVATGVFRIFQESLTNISRHSKATRVKVEMTYTGLNNVLRITDNGVGFSISNIVERKTLGLIGMQERAAMISGTLLFNSKPANGTEVVL